MTLRFDWKYLLLALGASFLLSVLDIALLQHSVLHRLTLVEFIQTSVLLTLSFVAFYLFVQYRALQRRRLFIALLDRLPASLVSKDQSGKILYCNQSYADLFGRSAKDMFDQKEERFIDKKSEYQSFIPLNSTDFSIDQRIGQPVSALYEQAISHTGKTRYFTSVKLPYLNINQQPCTLIYAQDVTEFHQYKQQAKLYQTQLEQVLEASEEGLWEWDMVNQKAKTNQRLLEIFDVEQFNALSDFTALIHPDDRNIVSQALEALVTDQVPFNIEFRIIDSKDNVRWVWDRGRVASLDDKGQIKVIVGIVMDITEEKANQEHVRRLAYCDPLTQLYNRSKLYKRFELLKTQSGALRPWYGLFFIDLDKFKHLNDNYGHGHGDELLKVIADRLRDFVCQQAMICRLGGDEFIVIFPLKSWYEGKVLSEVQGVAEQLLNALNQPCHIAGALGDNPIHYTPQASLGGIIFKLGADSDLLELRRLADIGLYRAKHQGGGCSYVFNLEEQNHMLSVSRLQKSLADGIVKKEFFLHYQPVVDQNGALVGAEALLRWQSPEQGLIMPNTFMPIAEESHAIIELGNQVIHMACQQLQAWQSQPERADWTLAINVSAKQLWQHDFVENFIASIRGYHFDPEKLIVEVTESVFIHDLSEASNKLLALKKIGVKIALDDFGTGYSSLNYLRELPLDELKIDKSFIQVMLDDRKANMLVETVVQLAKQFDLTIVAEGVEGKEHFAKLRAIGVELYQGYYFSKPLPLAEFHTLNWARCEEDYV